MDIIATESARVWTKETPIAGTRHRRGQMRLLMLLADVAAFAAAAGVVLALNSLVRFFVFGLQDLKYAVIPLFCLLMFANSKLYPGVGINPAEEIKLVTHYLTSGFLGGWVLLVLARAGWVPNQLAFPVLWAASILCVLLLRWSVRIVAAKLGMWGEPVIVIGSGEHVDRTIRYFADRPRLGYVPVLAAIDTSLPDKPRNWPVPAIEFRTLLNLRADAYSGDGIQTALVDVPAISEFFRSDESKQLFRLFRRVILVMDLDWIDGASMRIKDYEGVIGIAAEKSVLTPLDTFGKRALDIVVALLTGLAALPFMLAVALWIRLDSPGPVFYTQERPGKDGRLVKVYKFRTMFTNAESALKAYLRIDPKARQEWEANQKLCEDPRITRAGRFLRKFSFDEVPQLLNVLKGEMSLVGPRPIMEEQIKLYGDNMESYCGVRPGMTGLWQVSGRNKTTFAERVRFDTYYIRNWSVWLDFYILLRTVWVVLGRDGAY